MYAIIRALLTKALIMPDVPANDSLSRLNGTKNIVRTAPTMPNIPSINPVIMPVIEIVNQVFLIRIVGLKKRIAAYANKKTPKRTEKSIACHRTRINEETTDADVAANPKLMVKGTSIER